MRADDPMQLVLEVGRPVVVRQGAPDEEKRAHHDIRVLRIKAKFCVFVMKYSSHMDSLLRRSNNCFFENEEIDLNRRDYLTKSRKCCRIIVLVLSKSSEKKAARLGWFQR